MAEFPALPVFTDAYLADTRHLSTEEHGAYLLLLMCAWRTRGCALKDDDRFLARTVGVSTQKWRRMKPVLREFFQVEAGRWQQKKLTEVYRNVEARVAKNRKNGAKGGRARARNLTQTPLAGEATASATKARVQNPKQKAAAAPFDIAGILEAAGLPPGADLAPIGLWEEAGASQEEDVLPAIRRLRSRMEARSGASPASLAYYSDAILEARDIRVGARQRGQSHAADNPPVTVPTKEAFDPCSSEHWRAFLGDPTSRFRGDYLSGNWVIATDHPRFLARSIGPDPRSAVNRLIPACVWAEYGPGWGWKPAP